MENRLCLNKKPKYKLPEGLIIEEFKRGYYVPDFEPDLIINNWGRGRFCSFGEKFERVKQLWVKTDDAELIDFIKNYDFKGRIKSIGAPYLYIWRLKKIILEEFYGDKNGE